MNCNNIIEEHNIICQWNKHGQRKQHTAKKVPSSDRCIPAMQICSSVYIYTLTKDCRGPRSLYKQGDVNYDQVHSLVQLSCIL